MYVWFQSGGSKQNKLVQIQVHGIWKVDRFNGFIFSCTPIPFLSQCVLQGELITLEPIQWPLFLDIKEA